MEILFKYVSGAVVALLGMLCPITPLITSAMLFISIDFITGILASRTEARRKGEAWHLQSRKAWRTVIKAGFVAVAIVMMWIIDSVLLGFMHLNLANVFTGFVCGVELWSFVENASRISGAPLFEWISRWFKRRIGKEVGGE
jgi:phage-related holin